MTNATIALHGHSFTYCLSSATITVPDSLNPSTTYVVSPSSAVDGDLVSATCSGPVAALQLNIAGCFSLGSTASSSAPRALSNRFGYVIDHVAGDAGCLNNTLRSARVTYECEDWSEAEAKVCKSFASEVRPCAYEITVRSRAGCPFECPVGGARGTVCSGRGKCVASLDGARCACPLGFSGGACEQATRPIQIHRHNGDAPAAVQIGVFAVLLLAGARFWVKRRLRERHKLLVPATPWLPWLLATCLLCVASMATLPAPPWLRAPRSRSPAARPLGLGQPPPPLAAGEGRLPKCCCMGSGAGAQCWPPPRASGGRPYRVLFHSNQFGPRGTEVALFDYAASLEDALCGEAHVVTFGAEGIAPRMSPPQSMLTLPKFAARFPGRTHLLMRNGHSELDELLERIAPDAFYTLQSGERINTAVWPSHNATCGRVRTLLHGVFDGWEPHFDAYAVVSATVPAMPGVPVVRHIAMPPHPAHAALPGLREEWGVPPGARVFCRHGGLDSFDIGFAREAVCEHAAAFPADFFVLLNTDAAPCDAGHPNILHLPAILDTARKQQFLSSCNACLHGRGGGETYGLSVAECSMAGLPVLTHCAPPAASAFHLTMLGGAALLYCSKAELRGALAGFDAVRHEGRRNVYRALYASLGPEAVMHEFVVGFGLREGLAAAENPHNLSWQGRCEPTLDLQQ